MLLDSFTVIPTIPIVGLSSRFFDDDDIQLEDKTNQFEDDSIIDSWDKVKVTLIN